MLACALLVFGFACSTYNRDRQAGTALPDLVSPTWPLELNRLRGSRSPSGSGAPGGAAAVQELSRPVWVYPGDGGPPELRRYQDWRYRQ